MAPECILAIDLGTSGPKVALVTTDGEVLASEVESTELFLSEGGGAEQDPKKRLAILAEAEGRVLDAMPVLPIYYYVTKNMIRPWVKGWYHNVQDMHYPKFIWVDKHMRDLSR